MARALGADATVDAREQDVAKAVREATGGEGADVVIEASGAPGSPSAAIHAAKRGGRVVIVGLQAKPPAVDLFDAALREIDLQTTVAHVCGTDLPASLEVLAGGEIAALVLDRVIPLERIVDDGLVPLAEGRAARQDRRRGRRVSAPVSVGFAGIGRMGLPMARNLLAAGFPLTVFNRTEARCRPLLDAGAKLATSPAELARASEVVVTMVADGEAARSLIAGRRGSSRAPSRTWSCWR